MNSIDTRELDKARRTQRGIGITLGVSPLDNGKKASSVNAIGPFKLQSSELSVGDCRDTWTCAAMAVKS